MGTVVLISVVQLLHLFVIWFLNEMRFSGYCFRFRKMKIGNHIKNVNQSKKNGGLKMTHFYYSNNIFFGCPKRFEFYRLISCVNFFLPVMIINFNCLFKNFKSLPDTPFFHYQTVYNQFFFLYECIFETIT